MVVPGKLYFGLRAQAVDCLIGDMSVGGARVRVKPGTVVVDDLYLVHLREWTAYEARVAWRRPDGNLGLQFKRARDLEGAVAPELRVMREYCVVNDDLR
jgi:PilZ domain-containing protein